MKINTPTKFLSLAMIAGTLSMASVADAANRRGFQSTISAPNTAIKINVTISDELAYRADHVSPHLRDRRGSRGLSNGFTNRGMYGEKELDRLAERLEQKMYRYMEKYGVESSDDATTVLNLVITDVDNNRPTFKQLSSSPSLSYQSFGNGGAEFDGTLTQGSEELGTVSYSWFDNDIRHAAHGHTWSDANRAIDRFARKTAKELASN
ncbi:MAG: hypothetical protein EX271_07015 [Acidimicrobiales bacterium]|nr:hypothetical protein [Hyphomonadaceae bacterium]RZV41915.1 MAG: hypothetical protein EX271_07015 [Acidimicrobiales bacterium]